MTYLIELKTPWCGEAVKMNFIGEGCLCGGDKEVFFYFFLFISFFWARKCGVICEVLIC